MLKALKKMLEKLDTSIDILFKLGSRYGVLVHCNLIIQGNIH